MKILITGGLGYIASNCFLYLYKDHEIVLIDNLSNACLDNMRSIRKLCPSVLFYHCDLQNIQQLRDIFREHRFDVVVHLASLKSTSESIEKPVVYYRNNVAGTLQLLQVMKEFECKKIVFSSSACVYEESDQVHCETEDIEISKISNPYGRSKFFIESIIKDVALYDGMVAMVLRIFNPIGTIDPMIKSSTYNVSNLEDVIINSMRKNKPFEVFGDDYNTRDGTCIRDFIHIHDLCIAYVKTLEYISKISETHFDTLNIGCGKGITVMELIKEFESVHQVKLDYVISKRRPGDVAINVSDIQKTKEILQWSPEKTLTDMCKDIKFIN